MWILIARERLPDMVVSPGRRLLAAMDAMGWPALLMWALMCVPDRGAACRGCNRRAGRTLPTSPSGLVEPSLPLHELVGLSRARRTARDRTGDQAGIGLNSAVLGPLH